MNNLSDNLYNIVTDIIGAGRSIELLINDGDYDFLNQIYDLLLSSDQRLDLCILIAHINNSTTHQYKKIIDELSGNGWAIYETQTKYSANVLMIDKESLYLFFKSEEGYFIEEMENNRTKKEILYLFQTAIANRSDIRLLFEDILSSSFQQNSDGIVIASKKTWEEIISKLATNPIDLAKLRPREFEELIAELLIRENMQVQLTQQTRDGGVDIFAEKETIFGRHLYLVECKHNNRKNKVGVSIVRSLYGIVEDKNATKGIIVTTSDFTRGVKLFAELHKNRIDLKNYDSLVEWLGRAKEVR
jgi:hypothetical protein